MLSTVREARILTTIRSIPSTSGVITDCAQADLVQRLQAGDARACETVARTYGGRMLAVAMRLLGNEADAQDAVQDAFISAFTSIKQFQGESQLGTWLHRIAVTSALMKLRSGRRRPAISIEDMLPTFESDGHRRDVRARWTASAESRLEREETRELVRRKIALLPEDYRTVLVLRDIEELDTDTAAATLGIRPGAVKTRLHRARMALRELLDQEFSKCAI